MVYWQCPTRTEVESGLADQSLDLWNLPTNEKKTVGLLRTALKSIEAASWRGGITSGMMVNRVAR
jgi:hypothetical protein